jgi:hypothetical protein
VSIQPSKSVPKILALTPKAQDGVSFDIVGAQERLSNSLGANVQLIASTDWYMESFERCGGWESWAWETVLGKSFATRDSHFQGFVCLTEMVGRANALIINLALRNSKPVMLCVDGRPIGIVSAVTVIDSNDWKTGWGLVSREL